jgi:hypothetical protein
MFFFLRSIVCLMLITSVCLAQTRKPDIIVRRDNTKIEALIKEIDETTIKYQKFSNPDGPLVIIKKDDVVTILYANGEVENFEKRAEAGKPVTVTQNPTVGLVKTNQLRFQKGDGFYYNEGNIPRQEMPNLLKDSPTALKYFKKGRRWGRPLLAVPIGIVVGLASATTVGSGGGGGVVLGGCAIVGGVITGTVRLFSKAKNFRKATYEYNKGIGVGVSYQPTVTFGITDSGNAGFTYTF